MIREGPAQSGVFYRAVKRLNPHAPVFARLDHEMHGWAFKYDHGLPEMVRFLLAHRRHGPPAGGFAYSSWEPRATVWGWHIRALDPEGASGRSGTSPPPASTPPRALPYSSGPLRAPRSTFLQAATVSRSTQPLDR